MAEQDGITDGRRRRSDGRQTHAAILDAAMDLASVEGLASLTFGRLARELDISKSGVFAHFDSKQDLQQETIRAAEEIFEREVLQPGLAPPEGVGRLVGLAEAYLSYIEREVFPGGCFFAQILAEFDARDGPINEQLIAGQRGFLGLLAGEAEAAHQHGQLAPGVDAEQLAFEVYAPIELANYLFTLERDPVIVARGRDAVRGVIARAGGSVGSGTRSTTR